MKRSMMTVASSLVALFAVAAANPVDPTEYGRELTASFYAGDVEAVVAAFSPAMRNAVGEEAEMEAFRAQVEAELGEETELVAERVVEESGLHLYQRTARFGRVEGEILVTWAFDPTGTVEGFSITPAGPSEAAESRFLDYEPRAELRLPFEGEWTVGWGGRELEQNYHAAYADQRFAYDFLIVEEGSTHAGDGSENEHYHCFGRPVLAPAAGTVVEARDGLPDNVPGEMNATIPPGNHVVIDHGNDEYSFLAHLQRGTVAVSVGDRVDAGDPVGRCGNSGNSSEPHLHYHLQNTPAFGQGEGLPARFRSYVADGEPVELGEPVRGQRVAPALP